MFLIEDVVIPPNLKSNNLEERAGDPLTLPSETEFTEQAIDYVLENKVVPGICDSLENYGMEYYLKAEELSKPDEKSEIATTDFLDSIEAYYKFLACYEDKGEEDTLPEKVERKIDTYVSDLWLVRRR